MLPKYLDLNLNSWPEAIDSLLHFLFRWGIDIGGKLILCFVIYFIGRKLIHLINSLVGKAMTIRDLDASVASFLKSLIDIILTVALLIIIVNILGVNNSSLVALLASIGVAIGMALSGTLQNFAGGVMILLFRPFRVGDYVQAQGYEGTVKEIQIFSTMFVTPDNRTIFIPNGGLSGNLIINYHRQANRRIEWVVGVDYGTDFDRVKLVVEHILKNDLRILDTPGPEIMLKTMNQSSVDILIQAWVNRSYYLKTLYDINEQIYKEFTKQGISIPFPQITVHMANAENKN
ncbi:MAG: mechanosensitive ion channel [Candidatus Azobacteroides sp.]|nr:mechanosensitive ion channel [Candidatus Azobacteroides sp.]